MRLDPGEAFQCEGLTVREVFIANGQLYVKGTATHPVGKGAVAASTAIRKTTRGKVPESILARL